MNPHEHPFSWEALTRIVLMVIGLFLVWKALGAVVIIIVALVLAVSLYPLVKWLRIKTQFPLILSTLAVFILLFTPFAVVGFAIFPQLSAQFPQLLDSIDATIQHIPLLSQLFSQSFQNFSLVGYLQAHADFLEASSGTVIYSLISAITIIVLTFYFVYDYERLLSLFLSVFPYKEKNKLSGVLREVARVTGQYIRGNVVISVITTLVIFVGLSILNIPFAIPLALFAGILDLFPLVGSTLGAIPALFIAFSLSPFQGIAVLVLHLVYQQVENAIISPLIYNKALNLYPSLGFLSVVIGASLFGVLGAFLALPVAASIPVIVAYHQSYTDRHKNE